MLSTTDIRVRLAIVSLYTNIPLLKPPFPQPVDLFQYVLAASTYVHKYYFHFSGQFYEQKGVAMGSPLSVIAKFFYGGF